MINKKYKFIDDLSILEIINLLMIGISSYNHRSHVASDIGEQNKFIPSNHQKTQKYLEKINEWTVINKMKLNKEKSKYMIINFTKDWKFNTRLSIENQNIQQIDEIKLLGVWITDDLKWSKNTSEIVKNSYERMSILRKLKPFQVPTNDLINIYVLYIRS